MPSRKKDKLYIIIPAYNESENIARTVEEWYPVVDKFGDGESRLVIINDGSKDNTYEILKKLEKEHPKLKAATKENGGHGSTVLYGYRYAIKNRADYIFQTDSDGQTNPNEFEDFWRLRDRYDAIFGNRTERGDGQQRAFVEKTLCRILRHYFGVKISDSNAPFRLMRRQYVEKYIHLLPKDYNLPNVMFTTFGVYFGDKVQFIPISFKPRQGGTNSINVKKIVKIGWQALKDFKEISSEAKNEKEK